MFVSTDEIIHERGYSRISSFTNVIVSARNDEYERAHDFGAGVKMRNMYKEKKDEKGTRKKAEREKDEEGRSDPHARSGRRGDEDEDEKGGGKPLAEEGGGGQLPSRTTQEEQNQETKGSRKRTKQNQKAY